MSVQYVRRVKQIFQLDLSLLRSYHKRDVGVFDENRAFNDFDKGKFWFPSFCHLSKMTSPGGFMKH